MPSVASSCTHLTSRMCRSLRTPVCVSCTESRLQLAPTSSRVITIRSGGRGSQASSFLYVSHAGRVVPCSSPSIALCVPASPCTARVLSRVTHAGPSCTPLRNRLFPLTFLSRAFFFQCSFRVSDSHATAWPRTFRCPLSPRILDLVCCHAPPSPLWSFGVSLLTNTNHGGGIITSGGRLG
jgi:hypothetical protein